MAYEVAENLVFSMLLFSATFLRACYLFPSALRLLLGSVFADTPAFTACRLTALPSAFAPMRRALLNAGASVPSFATVAPEGREVSVDCEVTVFAWKNPVRDEWVDVPLPLALSSLAERLLCECDAATKSKDPCLGAVG